MSDNPIPKLPRLAYWLASRFIPATYREELMGDLQEMFECRLEERGRALAWLMYWVDTLHFLTVFAPIRKVNTQNNNIMIKSMLKIAWRNALGQKQTTILNIVGLTIGITTFLIIGLFVYHQSSYDRFHEHGDRIYRVNQPMIWGDWQRAMSPTGPHVATALKQEIPEFEEVTRLLDNGSQFVHYQDESGKDYSFKEGDFYLADENFFDVFTFEFYEGDGSNALAEPNSLVMTKQTAERYFGVETPLSEAVGKQVEIKEWDGSWKSYQVRAIIADIPEQSHLQFDIIASISSAGAQMKRDGWKWIWTAFATYGLVKEGVDIDQLTEKLQLLPPKWAPATTERIFNQTFEEFTAGNPWFLQLQPLHDIYLESRDISHNFGDNGNALYVSIFAGIALLVLILSCINFMNLTTARSAKRGKEVGVRKVLGSGKRLIFNQFIFESVLFVLVSTAAALIISEVVMGVFNEIVELDLTMSVYWLDARFWIVLLAFIFLLGTLAGSYPATYLSSFKTLDSLKGKLRTGLKAVAIRNGLVVMQFTISIGLIIFTVFVQQQIRHSVSTDLGFDQDHILQVHNVEQLGFETEVLKNRLLANPAVQQVGKSFGVPPYIWSGDRYKADSQESEVVQLSNLRTESDYLDLLGLEFVAGRNFDESIFTDRYKVILNEKAVELLGWGKQESYEVDSPIGKMVKLASGDEQGHEVIGVVRDFHFRSVRQEVRPLILINHLNDNTWDYGAGLSFFSLKIAGGVLNNSDDLRQLLTEIETDIHALDPSIPFEYSFLDQEFEKGFHAEETMAKMLNIFTGMALFIACMGLFGLAAFAAEQRTKEMGVRKVLGASVSQIAWMFSIGFLKLVLLSILIAVPLAWLVVDWWLADFATRTTITAWPFVITGLAAICIAFLTISWQSVRTAWLNPIEFLRDE